MIVAVSSAGQLLDDRVHTLFGRCDFFLIVDSETLEYEAVQNEFGGAPTGAGTACAQVVFDKKAQVLISGQVGPNAHEVLSQSGVVIYLSPPGLSVREAVLRYNEGALPKMEITRF